MPNKQPIFYTSFIAPAEAYSSLYVLRASNQDEGYNDAYEWENVKNGYSKSKVNFLIRLTDTQEPTDVKFNSLGAWAFFWGRIHSVSVPYSGIAYSLSGTIDFANATGKSSRGENVVLQNTVLGVISAMGSVEEDASAAITTDVAGIYAAENLRVEGSMLTEMLTMESNAAFASYAVRNEQTNKIEAIYDKATGNTVVVTAVRSADFSVEQNMSGALYATVSGVSFAPTKEAKVNYNLVQADGVLANSTLSVTSEGEAPTVIEGTGSLVFGGTVNADAVGLGNWGGSLNASLSGVTLGSTIFEKHEIPVADKNGNAYYNPNIDKESGQVIGYAETNYVTLHELAGTNGVDPSSETSFSIHIDVPSYEKKTARVLETTEKTMMVQQQVTVAVPVQAASNTQIRLKNPDGSLSTTSYTASYLNSLGYSCLAIKTDGGDFYTGWALDSDASSFYNGYLPGTIWLLGELSVSETTGAVTIKSATPMIQYEDSLRTIWVDTDQELVTYKAYRNQTGKIIDNTSSDGSGTWYVVEDQSIDPRYLLCKIEETKTLTVPVLTWSKSSSIGQTVDPVYTVSPSDLYADNNTATKYAAAQYSAVMNPNDPSQTLPYSTTDSYVWTWSYVDTEVDDLSKPIWDEQNVEFTDPDFVPGALRSEIQGNRFSAVGLDAKDITVSNMESSGVIQADVSEITLAAERAVVTFSGQKFHAKDSEKSWREANSVLYSDASRQNNVYALGDNTSEAVAVKGGNVNFAGTFEGSLISTISRIDTNKTDNIYNYELRRWEYTGFETEITGTDITRAAKAVSLRNSFNSDEDWQTFLAACENPDNPGYYVDGDHTDYMKTYGAIYYATANGSMEAWTSSYYQIDPDTGYFLFTETPVEPADPSDPPEPPVTYYIDPVTGYYVDPSTGYLYTSYTSFTPENQVYYVYEDQDGDGVPEPAVLHKKGDLVVLGEDQRYVEDPVYDELHHSKTLEVVSGGKTYLVERTIKQDDTKSATSGMTATAYGIHAEDTLNVSGNFYGGVFVSGDAEISRKPDGTVFVSVNDYSAEEDEAERELYRVENAFMYGLRAKTISVDGMLAADIYVVNSMKNWNTELLEKWAEKPDPVKIQTSAQGIVAETLKATALGGTVYVTGNEADPYEGEIFIHNASIAISVKNFQNDNDGSFDIIGDIYADYNGIFAGTDGTGFNLRLSGSISAGSAPANSYSKPYYAIVDAYGIYSDTEKAMEHMHADDRLELAAGSVINGNVCFGNGDDTLILDSNASLTGDVWFSIGTLNMVFNLNDNVMQETARNEGATITGEVTTKSTLLVAITLNDIDMSNAANRLDETNMFGLHSKRYTLIQNGTSSAYLANMEYLDLKYDGVNLSTLALEGTDIQAQIGYYDEGGNWVTVESSRTGYEFRDINFTAKIAPMAGMGYGNYVRIIDAANDDKVIFQAHSETSGGDLSIVVDILPDQVSYIDPHGDEKSYYIPSFEVGLCNLRERYDRENDTFTVSWDDNSKDTSQTTYQLEYYIQNWEDETHTTLVSETKTILQTQTNDTPRTEVTLHDIEANQTVVWRVRQAIGSGNDVTGDWTTVNTYERPVGLLQSGTDEGWTLEWRNEATIGDGTDEYYMLTVTVLDKATGETRQLFSDFETPDGLGWTQVVPAAEASKILYQIASSELSETESIASWGVKLACGDDPDVPDEQSEVALYQDLQITQYKYAPVAGLDAEVGMNKALILSWDNVEEEDVGFMLKYRIGNGEETEVFVDPVSPEESSTVSYLIEMSSYLKSDEKLHWEVYAYQKNGDESFISVVSTADTMEEKVDGKYTARTTADVPTDGRLGQVTFTWDNAGTTETTYLLEYQVNGVNTQVNIADGAAGVEYFVDPDSGKNRVSCTVKPSDGDITWRVRHYQKDSQGNLIDAGEWMFYEFEPLSELSQSEEIVTDPSTEKTTKVVTLHFISNRPGSAYRLEYVVLTQNGGEDPVAGNPVAVDFKQSESKVFSYKVEGLASDGSQTVAWRVTTVSDSVLDDWTYETPLMEKTFENCVFLDSPVDTASVGTGSTSAGSNAVATLKWEPGETVKNGLYTYQVQYFQKSEYLSADDVNEYLDTHSLEEYDYTQLEVTNNEVTISALVDTQYVYWRVRAQDNNGGYSDWTVGDTFHVYLEDKAAPVFSKVPVQSQRWTSQTDDGRDGNLMDVYLQWEKASDDKAGVKNYTFVYNRESGSDEQTKAIKYYCSVDGGDTWKEFSYDDENGARIDHIEGVGTYIIKIENLANGDYSWDLTATDYQSKTSDSAQPDADKRIWYGDMMDPRFAEDVEGDPVMTSTMAAFLSDTVPGSTATENKIATLAPILTWKGASDDWKEVGDGAGSGVESYLLKWEDSNGNSYSATIDAASLVPDPEDGRYTWQLLPTVPYDSDDERLLPNGEYTWQFYAVDFMGNVSVIESDSSSLSGTWNPDEFAPVWVDAGTTINNTYYLNLINVDMTWDVATDYWFDPAEDETPGSGVKYYTLTYWKVDPQDPDSRLGGDTKIIYTEYSEGWTPSFVTTVQNADYGFEISATDYMGNVSEEVLSGTWAKNDNPPAPPENITPSVSFPHAAGPVDPLNPPADWGQMSGELVWEDPSETSDPALFYEVGYQILLDASGAPVEGGVIDTGYILVGFNGTNVSDYTDFASFTAVSDNVWDVVFFRDPSGKSCRLTYDSSTSGYTMTFSLNGIADAGSIVYDAGTGTYSSQFKVDNEAIYEWTLTGINSNGGEVSDNGIWEGDTASPIFETGSQLHQDYNYIRRKNPAGQKETVNSGTLTILTPAIDYKTPGDPETRDEGTGVCSYTVFYGASTSETLDYSQTIYVDDFEEGEDPYFVIEMAPDVEYRYSLVSTDYFGNTQTVGSDLWKTHTSSGISGKWEKDSLAPRITDNISDLSKPGFTGTSARMLNVLTWTAATDDRSEAEDGDGTGTDFYTFTYSFGSGSDLDQKTYTFVGDDFDYFMNDSFSGYVRAENEDGVVTYTMSKQEDNGNSWKMVYTCKNTVSGTEAENGGKYVLTLTLLNEDYSWSLYGTDYAGNSGASSRSRSGKWAKDVAAPVFNVAATNEVGKGVGSTMYVKVTWSYKNDPTFTDGVVDPVVSTAAENTGSGVQYFYFRYKKTSASAWTTITVEPGKTASDANLSINCQNGLYTVYGADMDVTDYEWRIDAVDYMGNATGESDPEGLRSGTWTGDHQPPRFLPRKEEDPDIYVQSLPIYTETESGQSTLSLKATWKPAADDWLTVGDGNGIGVHYYTFRYRAKGSSDDWTETTVPASAVIFEDPEDPESDPMIQVNVEDVINQDYEWELTATDRAEEANTSEPLTGTILVDVTAPVFSEGTIALTNTYNAEAKTNTIDVVWTTAQDVSDPDDPTRPVSGFWKYDLIYRPADTEAWIVIDSFDEDDVEYSFSVPADLALADGVYDWKIRAYDRAGNYADGAASSSQFFIDTIAPVFRKFPNEDNYFHVTGGYADDGLYLTVEWADAYDAVSGVASYTFRYRNTTLEGDWKEVVVTSGTSCALTALENGDYEWELLAVDKLGNQTEYALTDSMHWADINAPVFMSSSATLVNAYDIEAKSNTLGFTWSKANEPNPSGRRVSGFKSYTIEYAPADTESWTVLATIDDQSTVSASVTVNGSGAEVSLEDGFYRWRINASDYAGNISTVNGGPDSTFVIDTVAPEFASEDNSVTYGYNPNTQRAELSFTWDTATDATSGFAFYRLCYGYADGEETILENSVIIADPQQTEYSFVNQTFSHDGVYSWWVEAVDNVGNVSTVNGTDTFTVDTVPPQGMFNSLDAPDIVAIWVSVPKYEHPIYYYEYTLIFGEVVFDLSNSFDDAACYQVRVFGRGSSGEIVRMKTFTTEETEFSLYDLPEEGIGYLANMVDNTVYWQVRALDASGNATKWYDGTTFQLVDPETDREMKDTGGPDALSELLITVSDSIDTGLLTFTWIPISYVFGMDSYLIRIYDSNGKTLLKTFTASAVPEEVETSNGEEGSTTETLDSCSLDLSQNELMNGKYKVSITGIDCAMVTGKESSRIAFTYDTVAPDFDPDSVKAKITSSQTTFTWDPMTDNIETGDYVIRIVRASNGTIIVNDDVVEGTSYTWASVAGDGDYLYSVYARDAHGNRSESAGTGFISICANQEFTWIPSATSRVESVGEGNRTDRWTVAVDDVSPLDSRNCAARLTFTIRNVEAPEDDFGGAGLDITILDQDGNVLDTASVYANSSEVWTGSYLLNESKSLSAACTVAITAKDEAVLTQYSFSVEKENFTESNTLDDTCGQARDNAAFQILLPEGELDHQAIVSNEWLGFSDDSDFRQIMVSETGMYSFEINSLSAPVKATLWQMQPDGQLMTLDWGLSQYGDSSIELDSWKLEQGETYYLSVEDPFADEAVSTHYDVLVSRIEPQALSSAAASPLDENDWMKNGSLSSSLGIAG